MYAYDPLDGCFTGQPVVGPVFSESRTSVAPLRPSLFASRFLLSSYAGVCVLRLCVCRPRPCVAVCVAVAARFAALVLPAVFPVSCSRVSWTSPFLLAYVLLLRAPFLAASCVRSGFGGLFVTCGFCQSATCKCPSACYDSYTSISSISSRQILEARKCLDGSVPPQLVREAASLLARCRHY